MKSMNSSWSRAWHQLLGRNAVRRWKQRPISAIEVVESRCLLSGVTMGLPGESGEGPIPVFQPPPGGPGDLLIAAIAQFDELLPPLLPAQPAATPGTQDPQTELPTVLTLNELLELGQLFGGDGIPFTIGHPLVIVPVDGQLISGIWAVDLGDHCGRSGSR